MFCYLTTEFNKIQNRFDMGGVKELIHFDRICMFTCTRNYLVSSLLCFRPLSRYALYYYIMAENHVANNQICLLCVVHCAVCACLKHDCLRVGLGYVEIVVYKS